MYYVCCGLLYGKEDQTLLINDEPNKVLWNPKWSGLFFHHSNDKHCKKKGAMVGSSFLFVATFG
jgi:hypothetical protein